MRKRIWIPCAIALAVCALLLLLKPTQHQQLAPVQPKPEVMNQSQPGKPPSVQHPQNTAVAQMLAKYPPNTPLAEGVAKTNPAAAIFLGMWQGSIEFYGKVVDESSNAVAGAQVAFKWVEVPTETGNRTAWTESEANGMFSLHGQHGLSLSVSVSKDGYYASRRDNDTFNFGPLEGEPFAPDQAKPVTQLEQRPRDECSMHLTERRLGKTVRHDHDTLQQGPGCAACVRAQAAGPEIRRKVFL